MTIGQLDETRLAALVAVALDEDLGPAPGRDVTTQSTIDPATTGRAELVARAPGVVAGLVVVAPVLEQVAARLGLPVPSVHRHAEDGDRVAPGQVLAVLEGRVQVLLVAERTLLNLASRASGVATHTRRWADVLAGTGASVLDTRKTTPGLRDLEKYAVRCGGGTNKRMGLYDVAMVKDNHVAAAGSVTAAVRAVAARFPEVAIQVEADTLDQAVEAVGAGARFLLLDNMATPLLAEVVGDRAGHGAGRRPGRARGDRQPHARPGRRGRLDGGGLPLRRRAHALLAHPRPRARPGGLRRAAVGLGGSRAPIDSRGD